MRAFSLIVLLFFTGCARTNFTVTDQLNTTEGLLAVSFDCGGLQTAEFYPYGTDFQGDILNPSTFKSSARVSCSGKDDPIVKITKVKAGDHFLGGINACAIFASGIRCPIDRIPEKNAYKFHIEPQAINYVGKIKSTINFRANRLSYNYEIEDNFEFIKEKLYNQDKEIVQKYKLINAPMKK